MATAFGHMSGWSRVEKAVLKSQATIRLLIGQAFFQTEPQLLLKLRNLALQHDRIQVRLAPAAVTFHPKIWILTGGNHRCAIVGSSNLSAGGFVSNVECNLFTTSTKAITEISSWFEDQWKSGLNLDSAFLEKYIVQYDALKTTRELLRQKLSAGEDQIILAETIWRKSEAISEAKRFWKSDAGKEATEARADAIIKMQEFLRVPVFDFTKDDYQKFIRIPELGRIRLAHVGKTIKDFETVLIAAKDMAKTNQADAIDGLLKVKGVGPNIASKIMAVSRPDDYFVINAPVSRALASFGYPVEQLEKVGAEKYKSFLVALKDFKEEAEIVGLQPAAALDAFFFEYRGRPLD